MGFNNIDNELNVKIFEIFRLILKSESVTIIYEDIIDNEEIIYISQDENLFKLCKYSNTDTIKYVNEKYYNLLSKTIKKENISLTNENLIKYVSDIKFFKLLNFLFGDVILEKNNNIYEYNINYNSIILPLDKPKYDKLMYYVQYTYKIQQLRKLNKTLKIEQTFNIFFEEEVISKDLYDSFYEYFKDIIKPPKR